MTKKHEPIPAHELSYLAKELNRGIRQLLEKVEDLRAELYIAAKAEQAWKRAHRLIPKCGTRLPTGRSCQARLEPGQFRCEIHARELSLQRAGSKKSAKKTSPEVQAPAEEGAVTSKSSRSARV